MMAPDQRERFMEIMRRHVRADDFQKSDADFIEAVFARWRGERGQPLIDPNE